MKGIKTLAQAVTATLALAAAGAASAAPIGPTGLFFAGRDQASNTSVLINLNLTSEAFLANPSQAISLGGAALAGLSSYLSTANLGTFFWNVVARVPNASLPNYGGLATSKTIEANVAAGLADWGLDAVGNFNNGTLTFLGSSNANLAASDIWTVGNASAFSFPGQNGISFSQFPGDFPKVNESVSFYNFFADPDSPDFVGNYAKFGAFTLNYATGTGASLSYVGPGGGAEIPLPAAAWLFGSALVGLGAAARRRKLASAV